MELRSFSKAAYPLLSLLGFLGILSAVAPLQALDGAVRRTGEVARTSGKGPAKGFAPFDAGKLDFGVSVAGVESTYRVFAFYVMPGDTVDVVARSLSPSPSPSAKFVLTSKLGTTTLGRGRWRFKAPAAAGLYSMSVVREPESESMTLNVFVLVPLTEVKDGKLGNYRIGEYPQVPLRGNPVYLPPRGVTKVTPGIAGTQVSPHFTLGQFLCKQEGSFPKYLVLREQLVLKLELLLEQFNQSGFRADGFGFISGYRTPYYNALIENVPYSRHTWGDAADIYLDGDGDGLMDDLDGDGSSGAGDAVFFRDFVEQLSSKAWYRSFEGGLGDYPPNAAHGPFVHIDCRGFRARWSG